MRRERAEHLMLVDLGRNDVAASPVRVGARHQELMSAEYSRPPLVSR
jgi:anthranilate/para-aminobenzoate synthase component I